ncbi:hypothetical protein GCM10007901_40460 [Dyella acidisoli]|uniref:Uncharacterized protein n=1 Tax=Dyella acidisoli TaxID=1867834 RepID=A0ABQ5XTQ1_9GAMM|nr:hypothetical protein GCM10007901_40460 [Dyella acidisoli]
MLVETQMSTGSAVANYQTQTLEAGGRLMSSITDQSSGSTNAGAHSGSTISFNNAGWI